MADNGDEETTESTAKRIEVRLTIPLPSAAQGSSPQVRDLEFSFAVGLPTCNQVLPAIEHRDEDVQLPKPAEAGPRLTEILW